MASGQTPNYALSQWVKDDRILMEDFNSDNTEIDAALQALADSCPNVLLRKIVTGTDATQLDVDLSDIDWSKYRHVLLHVDLQSSSGQIWVRLNGLSATGDYQYYDIYGNIANASLWSYFPSNTSATTYRVTLQLTGGVTFPECATAVRGGVPAKTYHCVNTAGRTLTTLNLINNSAAAIKAGSTISIYGVRV